MRHIYYIISITICLSVFSCAKEQENTTYDNQEDKINTYITSQLSSVEGSRAVYYGKATRLILKEGTGDSLAVNGNISFYYAGYVFESSSISDDNLFATNHKATADGLKWELSDTTSFDVLTVNLAESDFITGLKTGLVGVKGGEESIIVFPGKYGYGKRKVGTIPAKSALAYRIWVESINNE
ncbi:MAG: FKBP-type peptidyl-prolyl cis-trans isomerase [Bacteroidales bacterium]